MPPHGKPNEAFAFRKAHEIHALDANFDLRNVPPRAQDRLLLACWNIANFGVQNRSDNALDVLAHICSRFDLIAVQEVKKLAPAGRYGRTHGPDVGLHHVRHRR
jgi:hypothetical protein